MRASTISSMVTVLAPIRLPIFNRSIGFRDILGQVTRARAWTGQPLSNFVVALACDGAGERTMNSIHNFVRDDSGATAIEYALIASLIAVVIISAVSLVGTKVSTVFTEIGGALK